ncbi:PqqD family protein [Metabacillus herbersteinensis]|uniref:PqqD family protein n=1 Tax=Metabacillus herbersteinensis TaxID=283816 RepID=A0ABV6G8E1_9BACI
MNTYVQKNSYETVQMEGEWIILNTNEYTVTKLNEAGGFCWSLLEKPQTINSLLASIHEKYDIDDKEASKYVNAFLLELIDCGLIQREV